MQQHQFTNLRIPGFVENDYPKFTLFVKAYYEWLNNNGGATNVNKFRDIDETIDIFVDALKKEYLENFPTQFKGDVKQFLKHNINFYKSKGTEESLRFLFRLLFDADIDIQYPRDLIFTTSEGTWNLTRSIKIQTTDVRIEEAVGKYVYGKTSKSLAYVENVYQYVSLGVEVSELFISNIKGSFIEEDIEIILTDGHLIEGTTVTCITSFNITNGGLGYKIGQQATIVGGDLLCSIGEVARGGIDNVVIVDGGINYTLGSVITLVDPTGKGVGAELKITGIGVDGVITSIKVIKHGNGYEDFPQVSITGGTGAILTLQSNAIGKIKSIAIENHGVYTGGLPAVSFSAFGDGNATVVPVKGIMCVYPGKYNSIKSFISDVNVLQDGEKFQPYSYVIRSGQSIGQYQTILKKLVHPSGMLMLGEIYIEESISRTHYDMNKLGLYGGTLLRDIILLWESNVRSQSANLLNSKDFIVYQEVTYTVPSKSNVVNGIDWLYKFQFTSRQIKGFLNERISNYTFTSDRAFATAGKAIVGTITVGYDKIKVPVLHARPYIDLGNAGRAIPRLGKVGKMMASNITGRQILQDTWGDVISDVSKRNIQADAEITLLS